MFENNEHTKETELVESSPQTTPVSQQPTTNINGDHFQKVNSTDHFQEEIPRPSHDINSPRQSHDIISPREGMISGQKTTKKSVKKTKSFKDLEHELEESIQHQFEKVDTIYHKFKERDRSDSLIGAAFNFVNSTVGASTLSLPYVVYSCGILIGVPFILLGAIVGYITLSYLYVAHQYALERDPNIKDYENIGYLAYGWVMSTLIKLCILAFSFAALIGYVIIITDFTIPIWRSIAGNNTVLAERWLAGLIIIIPLFFLSQIKRMGDLRWISYLSVSCVTLFVGFLMVSYASGSTLPQKYGDIVWARIDIRMFKVLGIIIFAFSCHTVVAPINYEFKKENRHRVGFSIYLGILFSTIFFMFTAIFGYLCFLENTQGNILKSFFYTQETWYNSIFAAIFTLNIFVCFPIVCLPLKLSIDNLISPLWRWKLPLGAKPHVPAVFEKYAITKDLYLYLWDAMEGIRFFFITFFVCFTAYICGIFIPSIDVIFAIVGSTAGSLLAYVIPVMLYIKLTNHPWRNWRVIFSIFALIFAILVGVFVTIVTILNVAGAI